MDSKTGHRFNRRDLLKYGGAAILGSAAVDLSKPAAADAGESASCLFKPDETQLTQSPCGGQKVVVEYVPTSPFVLSPFTEALPVPTPLAPVAASVLSQWARDGRAPGPEVGRQASDGHPLSTHSLWPSEIPADAGGPYPDPIVYHVKLQVAYHSFTNSLVQPINALGQDVKPPNRAAGPQYLPKTLIWGFNGQFPGPMINARYGQPVLVRFENQLYKYDRQDFGAPGAQFLTHLHNGHTAPESDGNPHHRPDGYKPGEWVDNLYLNFPPDGDDTEKQSFLWFHDHFEGYTGANVYKGLVGLYPIYDEEFGDDRNRTRSGALTLDPGDEGRGLRLPGVRRDNSDGSFAVDYDIPLAIHDILLDDGVTPHLDFHNGCGEPRTDLWGQKFFKHYPNGGFVGDIFTVNGKAFPVLRVKRRRYRFRFLNASIARVYTFSMMTSQNGPVAARGTQGQWLLPDGQRTMPFVQISSEGGLLPSPMLRNSIELWPSRRKEVVLDFSEMQGKVFYLVNTMKMVGGRKPDGTDSGYKVPVLKIIVDDAAERAVDASQPFFVNGRFTPRNLRPLPRIQLTGVPTRTFELERGAGELVNPDPVEEEIAKEFEWNINDHPFQVCTPLATMVKGKPELWRVKNSGGGWVHPMHFHQEEHRIVEKNGVKFDTVTPVGPDDVFAKEDTISLGPGEEVVIYRNFRDFPAFPNVSNRASVPSAKYVAHCHNLAHEDHSMMFGWQIVEKTTT